MKSAGPCGPFRRRQGAPLMRLTLKAVDSEVAGRGPNTIIGSLDGCFYFRGGEAADWLDKTARLPTLSSLALAQWVRAFQESRQNSKNGRTGPRDMSTTPEGRDPIGVDN